MPVEPDDSDEQAAGMISVNRRRVLAGLVLVLMTAVVVGMSIAQRADRTGDRAGEADSGAPMQSDSIPTASSGAGPPTGSGSEVSSEPPIPGDPNATPPTLESVPLDETAEFGDQITSSLIAIEAIDGQGQGIGEISGPAIRVTIRLDNGTLAPSSLDAVTVNLYFGPDATPAAELSDPSLDPFSGSMDPGQSAQGVYVFSVPLEARDVIAVTVSHAPASSTVVFSGPFN